MNGNNLERLMEMLRYKRPSGSKSEKRFIARFIDAVPGMRHDAFGNRWIQIGVQPTTLISCHTDTVHSRGGYQEIQEQNGFISLVPKAEVYKWVEYKTKQGGTHCYKARLRDCLGADDGAGVFAALALIEAQIPALYVFHRGEEIGGIGSGNIALHNPYFLKGIERAIAIDRKGTEDIITHQMMGRCCSDDFAFSLAAELGGNYAPCPLGTFTDTANYTDLVPECTNLSAGYYSEHSAKEAFDFEHIEFLIDRLCSIDLESLPTAREAGSNDYDDSSTKYLDGPCICPEQHIDPICPVHSYHSEGWPDNDHDKQWPADSPLSDLGRYYSDEVPNPDDWCYRHHMRDCWECESEQYERSQPVSDRMIGVKLRTTE